MQKYTQEHKIYSYECDKDGKIRLLTLFNLLQHMADSHADLLDVGYKCFSQKNITWVGVNYALHINKRPSWNETVKIETWPSGLSPARATRDFKVTSENGDCLFTASSQWVIIDLETGRPQPTKKYVEGLESLPERALETSFPTFQKIERTDFEKHFYVRYDDIDINKHVNNAIYPVWASESVPNEYRENNDIKEIEITFKKSAFYGDEIIVLTQIEDDITIHQIFSSDKTKEFASVRIKWQRKSIS